MKKIVLAVFGIIVLSIVIAECTPSADKQFIQESLACLENSRIPSAANRMGASLTSQSAWDYREAVQDAQRCWNNTTEPEHELLLESRQFHSEALYRYEKAANYLRTYSTSGDEKYLTLAIELIAEGNSLVKKATFNMEIYNIKK